MRFDRSAVELKRLRVLCAAALAATFAFAAQASQPSSPSFSHTGNMDAPPGAQITVHVTDVFDNAGTNPIFTSLGAAVGSSKYYSSLEPTSHPIESFVVTVKTDAELNALEPPPDSPFTFTIHVGMSNDEGQTATGRLTFETTYVREEDDGEAAGPTFSQPQKLYAPVGVLVSIGPGVFDNAGTNPRITDAVFSTTDYYSSHSVSHGRVWITVKTAAELNALQPPPPTPFEVEVDGDDDQ